ncbi:hypothetical protein ACFFK0_20960 [Paenibacillus chartarius]|uniref:Uncharacterized protein n=1 Tax=Paenibacillus chartarius TaxID=747481 RepID=A0ABV6DQG0_9BACL
MSDKPFRDEYEKLFVELSTKVEKWLVRCIAAAAVLMLLLQALLQIPAIRVAVTRIDRLEGVPYRHGGLNGVPVEAVISSAPGES